MTNAVVVGAGPNGLAAAVELARGGVTPLVLEAAHEIGGGTRTAELTLPGFLHDVCSAIHPAGIASPFFNEIELGIEWIHPRVPFAHPLGDGRVVALHRSVEKTADGLGEDRDRYLSLMQPFVDSIDEVIDSVLRPVRINPVHKKTFARVAAFGGLPASAVAARFQTAEAKALLGGLSAHSMASFSSLATASVGLMLGAIGHAHGWPMAKGGSASITKALADRLVELGGTIETDVRVTDLGDHPADIAVLDVMPPTAHEIARDRIHPSRATRLAKWKPGPGVFKVDWALEGPIPWADPLSPTAGTVHVGGSYEEIAAAERQTLAGEHPAKPFVLLAQQSQFDDTRAPEGKHTAWGYCHVPNGSEVDMTEAIEDQIERFAPGFRDVILKRATRSTVEYEQYNANFIGGDIGGGSFGMRKVLQLGTHRPYALGGGIYLGSSAVPPGAGVHGMSGYNAARAALSDL